MARSNGSGALTPVLLLLCGIVLGSFFADLTADVSWLSWLAYGRSFGIGSSAPLVLDLAVVRLTFGLSFHLSIGMILGMALAFYAWRRWF